MVYVTGVTQGKLSKQAPVGHKSDGDTDGFVLAYNAFSGKRAWSTQLGASGYATEVNCVVVSRFGGVVVAGNSDASLFEKVRKKGNELFVARLNHAVGTVLRASQHAFMSDAVQTIPKQLLFSSDDAMIYVNLQLRHKNGHSKSMVTALSTSNFKVSPSMSRDVESVAGIGDVPMRLGVDRETGSMAVSYSTMRKGSEKHSFAVSILPRTRDRKATSASVHFTARSDDLATGIIINSAGYALMLGSSNQGETTHDAVPALWIYDVRTRATVRQYRGLEGVHEICNKISDFNVDSNGDIVFAGVRMREKEQHVLIGTFGIRDLEKYRTREEIMKPQAVIVEGNSTYVADEPGALVGQPSRKKSFWKRLDGKFSTGGISVIVVGSAFLILVLAVFVYCLRRKR